jgi:hypothetical protein
MAFEQIISMSFGKTSSHRLLVGSGPASSCTLDEINVGFGARVLLDLVYGPRRRWLQFERRHLGDDPEAMFGIGKGCWQALNVPGSPFSQRG